MVTSLSESEVGAKKRGVFGPHISVTPSGDFISHDAPTYDLIGNRGVLHDDHGNITKRFAARAWLACIPYRQSNEQKRPLTEPGRYTLLRFLDEATGFAAGHRPCWTCRRLDFQRFLAAWARGNLGCAVAGDARVAAVDAVLQRERIDTQDRKVTFVASVNSLPDGCMVAFANADYLVLGPNVYRWSPTGYTDRIPRPANGNVRVWTPRSIVAALRAGYVAGVHRSADTL